MDNTEDFFKNYRGRYSQYWIERWGLIPELPTSFDNANSIYELVAWLQRAFENLLDDFQQLESEFEDFKNALIDLLEYIIPELIRRYHDSAEFRAIFISFLMDILEGEKRTWLKDLLKELIEVDMREWIEDYVEESYEPELKEFIIEVSKARGGFDTLSNRLNSFDTKFSNVANGSPKGVYDNLSVLQTAKPNGDSGIYLTSNNGRWNYWNGTAWTDGGTYQSSEIAFGSITPDKLSERFIIADKISSNLFDKSRLRPGYYDTTGTKHESNEWFISDYIIMEPNTNYVKSGCVVTLFDSQRTFVGNVDALTDNFSTGGAVRFAIISVIDKYVDTAQLQIGDELSPYEDGIPKINTNKIFNFEKEIELLTNGTNSLFPWRNLKKVGDYVVNLGDKPVFQSYRNGNFIYFNIEGKSPDFKIEEGNHLVLEWDDNSIATESDFTKIKIKPVSSTLKENEHVLATRIANIFHSPIPAYQNGIDAVDKIEPLTIHDKLSDFAPEFYDKYLAQTSDVTIVLNGDSISTTNYYTTRHTDAKNRPPLMTENSYVSTIEEQLRWDGQKYYRYDTGIFTENASNKETLEYDLQNWDWSENNNRPALTRVLSGGYVSVSYTVPTGVKRCDFIYRTDCLNAENALVSIGGGNGIIQVFDESSQSWIEANGYIYSAKESSTPITTPFGLLMKSMYQKRLKMKVVGPLNNTTVTITNNGSGRLTYWGIQTSIREAMFDFILSARGGHSIDRLEQFEDWDTDYFKPDLILWEIPIINENLDVANADFTPKNLAKNTIQFAEHILEKAKQYQNKPYSPELVSWIMFFGQGNNALNDKNEWVYGNASDGSLVSVPNYISRTISLLRSNNVNILNLFALYMDYAKKRSEFEEKSISSIMFSSWGITIDGVHFNDNGTKLTLKIFDSFFLQ